MSTLQVANVHLESTGNNRIQYAGSNSFNIVAGGANTLTVNSTALNVNAALNVNGSLLLNSSLLIPTVNVQTFDSSGTWTKPSGNYRQYKVQLWGGGGAGAKGASGLARSGGGGGGYWEHTGFMYELGATETVTVGTGGPAQTVAGTAGANGGSSSFTRANSTTITVSGGEGGRTGDSNLLGGFGGSIFGLPDRSLIQQAFDAPFVGFNSPEAGYGGGVLVPIRTSANASAEITVWLAGGKGIWGGGGGGAYQDGTNTDEGAGGGSIYGGGGGGSGYEVVGDGPQPGGVSIFGGNGGAGGYDSVAGSNGSVPGGGGGGSEIANSGAGANGRVIVISW